MMELIAKLLKRLIKMFPDLDHQSSLEAYIVNKRPVDVFDVERFQLEFNQKFRG